MAREAQHFMKHIYNEILYQAKTVLIGELIMKDFLKDFFYKGKF